MTAGIPAGDEKRLRRRPRLALFGCNVGFALAPRAPIRYLDRGGSDSEW
jgi:hypothetical protein